jgi:hypothetical protein
VDRGVDHCAGDHLQERSMALLMISCEERESTMAKKMHLLSIVNLDDLAADRTESGQRKDRLASGRVCVYDKMKLSISAAGSVSAVSGASEM